MAGVVEQIRRITFSGMVQGLPYGRDRVKQALQFFESEWVSVVDVADLTRMRAEDIAAEFVSLHELEVATVRGDGLTATCRWDGEPGGEQP